MLPTHKAAMTIHTTTCIFVLLIAGARACNQLSHHLRVWLPFKRDWFLHASTLAQPAPKPIIQQRCKFPVEVPRAVHSLEAEAIQVQIFHRNMCKPDLRSVPNFGLGLEH